MFDTGRARRIEHLCTTILERLDTMAVTEAQFDADLEALVTAQTGYIQAVQAEIATLKAAAPQVDLTTEDTEVQNASTALATALAALNPTAAPSAPAAAAAVKASS